MPFDGATEGHFLVLADGHQWLLSSEALALLDAARTGGSPAEIAARLSASVGSEFTADAVHAGLQSSLVGLGLVSETSTPEVPLRRSSPLIFRVTLVKAEWVQWAADRLAPLIPSLRIFWLTFAAGLTLTMAMFALTLVAPRSMPFDNGRVTYTAVLVAILSTFAHEFGHATACAKGGARCGEIGFGIYWYFPVLFNRLDDAWRLSRLDRARVDAAGVYFQIGFVMIVCLIALIVPGGTHTLAGLPVLLFGSVASTSNPLLRFDGYWLATDLTGIANLRGASQDELRRLIGRRDRIVAGKVWRPLSSATSVNARRFLAAYAVVCAVYSVSLAVAGVQLLRRWSHSDARLSGASILIPVMGGLLLFGSFRATTAFVRRVLR